MGPVAIVTGSNTGIGYQTALSLARKGYTVVMACRSRERGEAAAQQVASALRGEGSSLVTGAGEAVFMQLDTSRLASVRSFAAAFLASPHGDRLHALVLSAGMNSVGMRPEDRQTTDGCSVVFESNFLGHFYLTRLLLPLMKATAKSAPGGASDVPPVRIVCLASVTHRLVSRRPDWARAIAKDAGASYALSKIAMVHFAYELQRRFRDEGVGDRIQAISVNPGGVMSDIWRTFPPAVLCVARPFCSLFFLNTQQGSATSVAAASAREPGGRRMLPGDLLYLTPYRIPSWGGERVALLFDSLGPFAGARAAPSTALSHDLGSSAALWEACDAAVERILGQQA
jgi:NAD(P)-dependent dehydrogenase (short-subunit alcohol dehydrogenase family)